MTIEALKKKVRKDHWASGIKVRSQIILPLLDDHYDCEELQEARNLTAGQLLAHEDEGTAEDFKQQLRDEIESSMLLAVRGDPNFAPNDPTFQQFITELEDLAKDVTEKIMSIKVRNLLYGIR